MESIRFSDGLAGLNFAVDNKKSLSYKDDIQTKQDKTNNTDEDNNVLLEIDNKTFDEEISELYLETVRLMSVKGKDKKKEKDTKDGKIGNTKQSITIGDCWLLAGVNSLSYTKEGKSLIKNALDYQKDGTMVHLKGAGDIWISNKEFKQVKKGERISAASGDDDMIIFEMAIEKVRANIASGKLTLKEDAPQFFFDDEQYMDIVEEQMSEGWINPDLPNKGVSTLVAGTHEELIYWISGKTSEEAFDKSDMDNLLNKFIENGNSDYVLGASLSEPKAVKDINGKKIKLSGPHAYAVKKADGKTVTFTDPHDSSKDIVFSREAFLKTFTGFVGCDLSNKNEKQDYFVSTTIESKKLDNGKRLDIVKDVEGKILKENTYDKDGNFLSYKKYSQKDGKPLKEINYKNCRKVSEIKYETLDSGTTFVIKKMFSKGKLKSNLTNAYYEDGQLSSVENIKYTDDKKVSSRIFKKYNKEGILTLKSVEKNNKDNSSNKETRAYNSAGALSNITKTVKNKDGSIKETFEKYDTVGGLTYAKYNYIDKSGKLIKTEIDNNGDRIIDETN